MTAVIQVKRGTAAAWTSANTVLAAGEIGFETDTKKMKVGDGSTAWTSLGYTATDGDISSVAAGTGLSGGGTSGAVTLNLSTPVATTNGGTGLSTFTTGDLIYASGSNTLSKLAIGSTDQVLKVSGGVPVWGAGSSLARGCDLKTVTQAVASTATVTLSWNQESHDTDNFHDNVTNNSRITIPTGLGGLYLFYAVVHWENAQTNTRNLIIEKNGSIIIGSDWIANLGHTYYTTQRYVGTHVFTAGDYIQVKVTNQDSGTRQIYAESGAGSLAATRFGVAYLGA